MTVDFALHAQLLLYIVQVVMAVNGRNRRNIKKMNLAIGSWNVHTLRDSGTSPERRTAITAKILSKYKIDITILSETRLANESQLEEVGSGYTYF